MLWPIRGSASQAKDSSRRRLLQGPVLLSQGFCKQSEQLNRGNGAGLVFHQRLLAALEQRRAGNVAPGGEVGQAGGSDKHSSPDCGTRVPLGLYSVKLSIFSRWGGEDKAGRDRCVGLGRMPLAVPRTTCASTGELGTPQNPRRYTQEEESG